jgi:PleD family two-component response regulator
VLRRADGAMYEAKSLGRNKIVMSAATKTQIVDRSS